MPRLLKFPFLDLTGDDLAGRGVNDADLLLSNVDVVLKLGIVIRDATKDTGDFGCRIDTLIAILNEGSSLLLS